MSTESLPPDHEPGESRDPRDHGHISATFFYDSRDRLVYVDHGDGRGPTPPVLGFDWEHLADKRLFALTENGKTEYWRDNPTQSGGRAGWQPAHVDLRTIGGLGTAVNTSVVYDAANRVVTITDQTGGGTRGDLRLQLR